MKQVVRQLRNGQITIPKRIREKLGLAPDDLLSVELVDGRLEIERIPVSNGVGSPWLRELYDLFAPARKSLEGYSEREINDAIDYALEKVRDEEDE